MLVEDYPFPIQTLEAKTLVYRSRRVLHAQANISALVLPSDPADSPDTLEGRFKDPLFQRWFGYRLNSPMRILAWTPAEVETYAKVQYPYLPFKAGKAGMRRRCTIAARELGLDGYTLDGLDGQRMVFPIGPAKAMYDRLEPTVETSVSRKSARAERSRADVLAQRDIAQIEKDADTEELRGYVWEFLTHAHGASPSTLRIQFDEHTGRAHELLKDLVKVGAVFNVQPSEKGVYAAPIWVLRPAGYFVRTLDRKAQRVIQPIDAQLLAQIADARDGLTIPECGWETTERAQVFAMLHQLVVTGVIEFALVEASDGTRTVRARATDRGREFLNQRTKG